MILQLKKVVQQHNYFALALDESTDFSNISQLSIFICTAGENFTVCKELLKVLGLPESSVRLWNETKYKFL